MAKTAKTKTAKKTAKKTGNAAKKTTSKPKRAGSRKKKAAKSKKKTAKKTASSPGVGRRAKRGPQGKRLGEWVLVQKDEVFDFMRNEGVGAAALADALGVSSTLISRWKAGDRIPSEVAQKKLREVLDGRIHVERGGRGYGGTSVASPFDGKGLERWRKQHGLSRKKLATRLGVSVGSIFGWERGTTEPRGENRQRLDALLATSGAIGEGASSTDAAAIRAAGEVLAAYVAAGHELEVEALCELAPKLIEAFSA